MPSNPRRLLNISSYAPSPSPPTPAVRSSADAIRPGITVIVTVLTIIFALTALLLLYAKHTKRRAVAAAGAATSGSGSGGGHERRHSGIERSVVESLPVFRFDSLTGHKAGLECAVCLNAFEPTETLRLLPKCRHGFHVECVDRWLDAHSACPLCRMRVQPEDVLLLPPQMDSGGSENSGTGGKARALTAAFTRRLSGRHSSAGEKFRARRSSSVTVPASRRRRSEDFGPAPEGERKDGLLLTAEEREAFERRNSHRIVIAGERWSDLRPSEMLYLRKEMIVRPGGAAPESKGGVGAGLGAAPMRCASDITGVSRRLASRAGGIDADEPMMSRWLSFAARRTARWLKREGGNAATEENNSSS